MLISNLLNLGFFVFSDGFNNWKVLSSKIKRINKNILVVNDSAWKNELQIYLNQGMPIDEVKKIEELKDRIEKNNNQIIYLHFKGSENDETMLQSANLNFKNQENGWDFTQIQFLEKRNLTPTISNPENISLAWPVIYY
jgi:hypothetical protein